MDVLPQPYTYEPLPPRHFRILELATPMPEPDNCALIWSLKVVPFPGSSATVVPYDALSYTWGDLSTTYPLTCDGQTLQIHHNLHEALPFLARRPSRLPLWIDAVCINQSDEAEKIEQIRLMSTIYREANCVWAWLGVGDDWSCSEAVESILPRMKEVKKATEELARGKPIHPSSLHLPAVDSPVWDAFIRIVNSTWYGRLWVVQEASLARNLIFLFGHFSIPEKTIETAMRSLTSLRDFRDENGDAFRKFERLKTNNTNMFYCRSVHRDRVERNKTHRHDVAYTLGTINTFITRHGCSDPRDRVLALLGFMDGYEDELVYDESTTIVDLYVQFWNFVFHAKDPTWAIWGNMLGRAVDPAKNQQFPSWCADLHSPIPRGRHFIRTFMGMNENPRASSRQRASRRGQTGRELVIRGTIFDVIAEMGKEWIPFGEEGGSNRVTWLWLLHLYDWESYAAALASRVSKHSIDPQTGTFAQDGAGTFNEEDYWNTLSCCNSDLIKQGLTSSDFLQFKSFLSQVSETTHRIGLERICDYYDFEGPGSPPKPLSDAEKEECSALLERMEPRGVGTLVSHVLIAIDLVQSGARVFITKSNRFGFVKGHAMTDDQVCLFDGAPLHYSVRQCAPTSPPNQFKLTGEVYIHHTMNGEVDTLGLESQELTLI